MPRASASTRAAHCWGSRRMRRALRWKAPPCRAARRAAKVMRWHRLHDTRAPKAGRLVTVTVILRSGTGPRCDVRLCDLCTVLPTIGRAVSDGFWSLIRVNIGRRPSQVSRGEGGSTFETWLAPSAPKLTPRRHRCRSLQPSALGECAQISSRRGMPSTGAIAGAKFQRDGLVSIWNTQQRPRVRIWIGGH